MIQADHHFVKLPHHNPLQPRWQLAAAPEDYTWSSTRYYLKGEPAIIPMWLDHSLTGEALKAIPFK